jgi:hypothetical protein
MQIKTGLKGGSLVNVNGNKVNGNKVLSGNKVKL